MMIIAIAIAIAIVTLVLMIMIMILNNSNNNNAPPLFGHMILAVALGCSGGPSGLPIWGGPIVALL